MNNQPKIFVIVVTYKGMRWYDKCFSSLRESTMPVQTIVVDNTPGEEDANYIREHFPEIVVLKPEQNLGFGKGNNLAMRYALDNGCDYVFLLNQDAWVDKDTFVKLVSIHSQNPEYGLLSPLHVTKEKNKVVMYLDDGHLNTDMFSDAYYGSLRDHYDVKYVNAAAWLLPRKTLETIGLFDPIFLHFGEDDDYLNRLFYHHVKVCVCPCTTIVHDCCLTENPLTGGTFRRHLQTVLMECMDLNKPESTRHRLLALFKKGILNTIKFQFGKAKDAFAEFEFLYSRRRQIHLSRQMNSLMSQRGM